MERKDYIDIRDRLLDQQTHSTKTFDTFIITLCSTLFGLSFIIINGLAKINPVQISEYFYILLLFWLTTISTIIVILIGYNLSTKNILAALKKNDLFYQNKSTKKIDKSILKRNSVIDFINNFSLFSFSISIILFLIFNSLIYSTMENSKDNKAITITTPLPEPDNNTTND